MVVSSGKLEVMEKVMLGVGKGRRGGAPHTDCMISTPMFMAVFFIELDAMKNVTSR